ncbi:MAG: GTP 3',8-cyclase MoaA [Phycisphaerae bacterium]
MTTATCQRRSEPTSPQRGLALPVLGADSPNPNPNGLTGPRDISAVQMLRISVTDVCNLRCVYCMPAEGVEWLPKSHVLTYEEIATVVRAATSVGVTHFKLTGGEPTARRDLPVLVDMLRQIPGVRDLSLTTNGILLAPMLEPLKHAGLNRITISLDSLRPERFEAITRGGRFEKVWASIERALALGFERLKINVVVMKGMNEDEIPDFAALTLKMPITVRFIEFMPLGRSGLTDNPEESMITEAQIRRQIEQTHGPLAPVQRSSELGVGPAKVWQLPDAQGRLGFISAMSHPFCDTCNRLRLTPDGLLRSCLFDGGEVDLKPILRQPTLTPTGEIESPEILLANAMTTCVALKPTTHSSHGNKAMNRIGG